MQNESEGKSVVIGQTPIQQFYNGQSILVTGATGFVGKVVVEKLLRSCPGVKQIFLLIREKRGQDINERMNSMLNKPVFDEVRRTDPRLLEKLVPLCGDLSEPGLGLSQDDGQLLRNEVTTVFHIAASVRFDVDVKAAVKINVCATQEVTRFANSLRNLKAFVYVSTAYSNCISSSKIEEIVYDYRTELASVNAKELNMDQTVLNEFVRRWPSTYQPTKAMAEMVVEDNFKTLPAAILRPSIVISSWEEPFPGWLDSYCGPTLHVTSIAQGYFHCLCTSYGTRCDIVPVDMVASAIIAAAWDVSTAKTSEKPRVYNFVLGETKPLTWDYFLHLIVDATRCFPSTTTKWYPFLIVCQNRIIVLLKDFLLHLVPSFLLDVLHVFMTGKRRHFYRYVKIKRVLSSLDYFLHRQWKFEEKNVKLLLDNMTPEDRQIFRFDVREIKWKPLLRHYVLGIRRHLLNEADETIPYCKKNLQRLYLLHCFTIVLTTASIFVLACFVVWKIIIKTL